MCRKVLPLLVVLGLASVAMAQTMNGYANDFTTLTDLGTRAPMGAPYITGDWNNDGTSEGPTGAAGDIPGGNSGYFYFDVGRLPAGVTGAPCDCTKGVITYTYRYDTTGTGGGQGVGYWLRVYTATGSPGSWTFDQRADYWFPCNANEGWVTRPFPVEFPMGLLYAVPYDVTRIVTFRYDMVFWDAGLFTPGRVGHDTFNIEKGAAPVAVAKPETQTAKGPGCVPVQLDGRDSIPVYDSNTSRAGATIVDYLWFTGNYHPYDPTQYTTLAHGAQVTAYLPPGTYTIGLAVICDDGVWALDYVTATVVAAGNVPAVYDSKGFENFKLGPLNGQYGWESGGTTNEGMVVDEQGTRCVRLEVPDNLGETSWMQHAVKDVIGQGAQVIEVAYDIFRDTDDWPSNLWWWWYDTGTPTYGLQWDSGGGCPDGGTLPFGWNPGAKETCTHRGAWTNLTMRWERCFAADTNNDGTVETGQALSWYDGSQLDFGAPSFDFMSATGWAIQLGHDEDTGSGGEVAWIDNFVIRAVNPACDTNCDGSVNGGDIESFINLLNGVGAPCATGVGDTNHDGSINGGDIERFINCLNNFQ